MMLSGTSKVVSLSQVYVLVRPFLSENEIHLFIYLFISTLFFSPSPFQSIYKVQGLVARWAQTRKYLLEVMVPRNGHSYSLPAQWSTNASLSVNITIFARCRQVSRRHRDNPWILHVRYI